MKFFSSRIYDSLDEVLSMLDDENSDFDSGGLVLIWYDAITVCPTSFCQKTSGLMYDRFIEVTPAPILINLLIDVLQIAAALWA